MSFAVWSHDIHVDDVYFVFGFCQDPNLSEELLDLCIFLERLSGGEKIGLIFYAVDATFIEAHSDDEFWKWFSEQLFPYIRKVLLQTGYILDQPDAGHDSALTDHTAHTASEEAKNMRNEGFRFYGDKYLEEINVLRQVLENWWDGVKEDELNRRFWGDWATLFKDLLKDEKGKWTWKKKMWGRIVKHVIPIAISRVRLRLHLPRLF